MERFVAIVGRCLLKGYSLLLLLILWLVSISVNASGGTAAPMYGVIAMYGPPEPEYGVIAPFGCTITWTWAKTQDVTAETAAGDYPYEP